MKKRNTKEVENKKKERHGLLYGLFVLIKFLLKVFFQYGIWIPAIYTLLGVALNKYTDINVLDFSVKSAVYISGWVVSIICAIAVIIYRLIVQPIQNRRLRKSQKKTEGVEEELVVPQYNEQFIAVQEDYVDELRREQEKRNIVQTKPLSPEEEKRDFAKIQLLGTDEDIKEYLALKANGGNASLKKEEPDEMEIPDIYFSKLQPNILVHEYSDRFEMYRVEGERTEYVGVAHK